MVRNLWTTINVKNMDESVAFYNEILGLSVDKRYTPAEGIEIAFLGSGETKFELIYNGHLKDIQFSNCVSTGFAVESVDEYIEYLDGKGIAVLEGPFEPAPHIKFFYVSDPNGYRIQLVEER